MQEHLTNINVDGESIKTVNKLVDDIFQYNDNDVIIELLVINYDDNISIDIKDEGKQNFNKSIDKVLSDNENIKFTEVLGFNNIEYIINKS